MAVTANPNIIMGFRAPEIQNPMALAAQGEQIRTARNQNAMAEATLAAQNSPEAQRDKQIAAQKTMFEFAKQQAPFVKDFNQYNEVMQSQFGDMAGSVLAKDQASWDEMRGNLIPRKGQVNPAKPQIIRGEDDVYAYDIDGNLIPLGVGVRQPTEKVVTPEQQNLNALKAKDLESKIAARTTATPPPSNEPIFEAETVLSDLADLKSADLSSIYGKGESLYPDIARKQANVDLMAKRDRVVNLTSLESRNKLKGQGTITDQESAMLAKAATILSNPEISPDLAAEEIARVEAIFQRSRDRASQRAGVNKPTQPTQLPPVNANGWKLRRNKTTGEQAYFGPNGEIERVQ